MSGQALGGVCTAIIEIITITFATDPSRSAFVFFIIGNVLLLLSLIAYIIVCQTEFFEYFTVKKIAAEKARQSRRNGTVSEPVFREVLNKMWLYGFTEWMVINMKRFMA